jgi:hypothetical protein
MKKIMIAITACFVMCFTADAQTWSEWFRQKKTQKKYLLQQIAALKVYIDYAQKGYQIAADGVHAVRDIKRGDFDLHDNFFKSLSQVNPAIKKYAKISGILLYQLKIISSSKESLKDVSASKQFTPEEIEYCKSVLEFLFGECKKSVDELISVITSGEAQMKDDERLKRIDKIYLDMQNKYAFCSSFNEEMGLLNLQRTGEQVEINRSKILNGIK